MNDQNLDIVSKLISESLFLPAIDPHQDLFEAGYLDSIGVVNIVVALEEQLQLTLSMEDLDLDQFRTISQICQLVTPLLASSENPATELSHHFRDD
jgi:acyl carrier protein